VVVNGLGTSLLGILHGVVKGREDVLQEKPSHRLLLPPRVLNPGVFHRVIRAVGNLHQVDGPLTLLDKESTGIDHLVVFLNNEVLGGVQNDLFLRPKSLNLRPLEFQVILQIPKRRVPHVVSVCRIDIVAILVQHILVMFLHLLLLLQLLGILVLGDTLVPVNHGLEGVRHVHEVRVTVEPHKPVVVGLLEVFFKELNFPPSVGSVPIHPTALDVVVIPMFFLVDLMIRNLVLRKHVVLGVLAKTYNPDLQLLTLIHDSIVLADPLTEKGGAIIRIAFKANLGPKFIIKQLFDPGVYHVPIRNLVLL